MSDTNCPLFQEKLILQKNVLRRPFNVEDKIENVQIQNIHVNHSFIKLTSAYSKNSVLGIIRHSKLYYARADNLINEIKNMLREHSLEMNQHDKETLVENLKLIKSITQLLIKIKNEWIKISSKPIDPDFEKLIYKGGERFDLLLKNLDNLINTNELENLNEKIKLKKY